MISPKIFMQKRINKIPYETFYYRFKCEGKVLEARDLYKGGFQMGIHQFKDFETMKFFLEERFRVVEFMGKDTYLGWISRGY